MTGPSDTIDAPFLATADRLGVGVAFALSALGSERRFTFISPACADLIGTAPEQALDGQSSHIARINSAFSKCLDESNRIYLSLSGRLHVWALSSFIKKVGSPCLRSF